MVQIIHNLKPTYVSLWSQPTLCVHYYQSHEAALPALVSTSQHLCGMEVCTPPTHLVGWYQECWQGLWDCNIWYWCDPGMCSMPPPLYCHANRMENICHCQCRGSSWLHKQQLGCSQFSSLSCSVMEVSVISSWIFSLSAIHESYSPFSLLIDLQIDSTASPRGHYPPCLILDLEFNAKSHPINIFFTYHHSMTKQMGTGKRPCHWCAVPFCTVGTSIACQ